MFKTTATQSNAMKSLQTIWVVEKTEQKLLHLDHSSFT